MSSREGDRESQGTIEIARLGRGESVKWSAELQDDAGGRVVPLSRAQVVVGAGAGADIAVADATVSARHVALLAGASEVTIRDLGSKNGTFVGGARVTEARGDAGTTIVIGRSTLTLRAESGDGAQEEGEPLAGIAGGSVTMRRIAAQVRRCAAHGLPVLVTGDTGTGKELIARALHDEGPRAKGPFVAVNVASLPRDLVESEMFGHERGAFTGAVARRLGAFYEADGGTLFLDEIGDLPSDAQPKLLRALDGYEVRGVGATGRGKTADVRIVAATNHSLEKRVEEGAFRRDLFHRLATFRVALPALSERRGDIGPIARAILAKAPPELTTRGLTSAALSRLIAHDWPGNVRELRNVLYRASDLARQQRLIDVAHVEQGIDPGPVARPAQGAVTPSLAKQLLDEHGGNVTAAARAAGLPRTTFRKRLKGGS
jgi:DNA-binding NtrC family response regulator